MSEKENKLPEYFTKFNGKRKGKDEPVTVALWEDACKGCGICVEMCPTKVWKMTETLVKWNGTMVTVDDPNNCTKCMLCEMHCPDFAIKIV
ncbi:MAG: 4Fe-4S binding protein [Candidatus Delongbacteria bacterium]|nr:4Fe-4S binding protein [Candidatus Delongbacteria bacterium]MBN2834296.1 4Fe-4S binding protein [Candidatus Delongbacteria bacterium]